MSSERSSWWTRVPGSSVVWVVLAALLVWFQLAFVGEFRRVGELYDDDPVTYSQSWLWRPGLRPPRELATFLEAAKAVVPEGSAVVFSCLPTTDRQDFARSRWAAYLMPEYQVMPAGRTSSSERAVADFWIVYRNTDPVLGGTAVWRHRDGVVYRIER